MRMDEWISWIKSIGGIDTDGYYGKQCMDLYNSYCDKVLGITGNTGASCAKEILNNNNVMNNVSKIDNYAEFIPNKGDICVWNSGTYGHVAICLGEGDLGSFKTLDQNWKPLTLTEETHNYTYMAPLVFLRPKNQSNIIDVEVKEETANAYSVGQLVVYSSCYKSSTDVAPNYIDCIKTYGAWQQRKITEIVEGQNKYKLDNGLYINDGDVRMVK